MTRDLWDDPFPPTEIDRLTTEIERLTAVIEDAIETLEAMNLHDNALYRRLRAALEPKQ
jgi:hypothetical protein